MKKIFLLFLVVFSSSSFSYESEREIKQIQVLEDTVRIEVGVIYGSCSAEQTGWIGWSNERPSHSAWLALALSAQAQGKKITFYEAHGSCGGLTNSIKIEGLYIK
ncbi:MAG: hypothetical protein V7785_08090 [Bermanella sp.]